MTRPTLELAGIFRRHGPGYRETHSLPVHHHKLMRAIETCRTAALGGHVEKCGHCQHTRNSYNSCWNRHCPKCQGTARDQWLAQRKAELLPVPYFHVVFTLPQAIAAIAYQNKAAVYGLLFQTAAAALLTIARDPKHLGTEAGFFGVLHTWGQTLQHHPHIHCVVAGGGLSADRRRWIRCRPRYYLPVRVLSALFRRLFLEALQKAYRSQQLQFFSELEPLREPAVFAAYLKRPRSSQWVVYAKAPFGGPEQAIAYLGRYTHRVAISNHRLRSLANGQVSFEWKDRDQNQSKTMTLEAGEFIRRFLLHSLPPGFQRIRHYGFLANVHRRENLALCRELLTHDPAALLPAIAPAGPDEAFLDQLPLCPVCGIGVMIRIERLLPLPAPGVDSS